MLSVHCCYQARMSSGSLLRDSSEEQLKPSVSDPSWSLRQGLNFSLDTKMPSGLWTFFTSRAALQHGLQDSKRWLCRGRGKAMSSEKKTTPQNNTLSSNQCLTARRTKGSWFYSQIQTQTKWAVSVIDRKCRIVCSPNFSCIFLQSFQITSQILLHLSG